MPDTYSSRYRLKTATRARSPKPPCWIRTDLPIRELKRLDVDGLIPSTTITNMFVEKAGLLIRK